MRRSVRLLPEGTLPRTADSVLDVGCGIRPQDFIATGRHVCVDAHQPYLDRVARRGHVGEVVCSDWRPALKAFRRDEFDVVVALDFIEHLTRRDGRDFLRAAGRVGRTVCIFTPFGPFPASYGPGEPDQWGMDGGDWQTHRSAWTPDDFNDGWETHVLPGFHRTTGIGAFWAVRRA